MFCIVNKEVNKTDPVLTLKNLTVGERWLNNNSPYETNAMGQGQRAWECLEEAPDADVVGPGDLPELSKRQLFWDLRDK